MNEHPKISEVTEPFPDLSRGYHITFKVLVKDSEIDDATQVLVNLGERRGAKYFLRVDWPDWSQYYKGRRQPNPVC